MLFYRFFAICLALVLFSTGCKTTVLPHKDQEQYAEFAPVDADPLHFSFDWRMGVTDSIRAGSALFFRCTVPHSAGHITTVHLVDKYNSQYGIAANVNAVEGSEHTLLVFAFTPEETAKLPAGTYSMAVSIGTETGEHLTSALLSFALLAPDTPLSKHALTNERRRFAALLSLQGDEESFATVAASVLPPNGEDDVISRVLALFHQSSIRVGQQSGVGSSVTALNDYANATLLSQRERAAALLALSEAQLRAESELKNDR